MVASVLGSRRLLSGLGPHPTASAASATGLALLTVGVPVFGASMLAVLLSSAALRHPGPRRRPGTTGMWLALWPINGLLSLRFMALVCFMAWAVV